jgi:hypothetical protein
MYIIYLFFQMAIAKARKEEALQVVRSRRDAEQNVLAAEIAAQRRLAERER